MPIPAAIAIAIAHYRLADLCTVGACANHAAQSEKQERCDRYTGDNQRHQDSGQQRQRGPGREGCRRPERRLDRLCRRHLGHGKFVARVRVECILGHELNRDLECERSVKAALHVDMR